MQIPPPNLTVPQTRLLATVINTTRTMLELAGQEQWDAVADLEKTPSGGFGQVFRNSGIRRTGELPAEALAVLASSQ